MAGPFDTSSGLDALVSGKRRVPRVAVQLSARIKAAHGEFEASVHDLSPNGALVLVPVSELPDAPEGPLGPAQQFAVLEHHFRDSFDLSFVGRGIVVETQVVRMLVSADGPENEELALGCQFVSPLTARQQDQLGLLQSGSELESWGEAIARHEVYLTSDPARPVAALLLEERAGVAGPPYVGAVRGVGPKALTVRLVGVTRSEAREHMGRAPVYVRILRGPRELHAVHAELIEVCYSDEPAPGVEMLFATRAALPRAVRRNFREA